jgi:hypothetical protein
MVKEKLIFNNNNQSNGGKTQKKKTQPVHNKQHQQEDKKPKNETTTEKQKQGSVREENKEQTTATETAAVVPSKTTTNDHDHHTVTSDHGGNGTSPRPSSDRESSIVDEDAAAAAAHELALVKQVGQLINKIKKYKQLEEDIQTELDILQVEIKTVSKKQQQQQKKKDLSIEEKEELDKRERELNEQKKRQKRLQDIIDFLRTTQTSLESLNSMASNVSKVLQRRENAAKSTGEKIRDMEKEVSRKEKRIAEQEREINELRSLSDLHNGEVNDLKKQIKIQEEKLSDYEQQIHRLSKQLSGFDALKEQVNTEIRKNRELNQQHEHFVQQLQRELRAKQEMIDRCTFVEQQKNAVIMNHVNDLRQKSAQLLEIEAKLREQTIAFNKAQEELARMKSLMENSEKQLDELRLRYESSLADLKNQSKHAENLTAQLDELRQRYQQLQHSLQIAENNARRHFAHVQELEKKLQEQPPIIVPVKFEEDVLSELARQRSPQQSSSLLKDIIKLIQVVDYFDLSKPDGMDMRDMFLSDQIGLRRDGKHTMFASFSEFDAFDHFCRIVRGKQQQPQSRESAIADAVVTIQKLLAQSKEEIIPGVSYEKLNRQLIELQSSNLYLTGRTLYPYNNTVCTVISSGGAGVIPGTTTDMIISELDVPNLGATNLSALSGRPDLLSFEGFDFRSTNVNNSGKQATEHSSIDLDSKLNISTPPQYLINCDTSVSENSSSEISSHPSENQNGANNQSLKEDSSIDYSNNPEKKKKKRQPRRQKTLASHADREGQDRDEKPQTAFKTSTTDTPKDEQQLESLNKESKKRNKDQLPNKRSNRKNKMEQEMTDTRNQSEHSPRKRVSSRSTDITHVTDVSLTPSSYSSNTFSNVETSASSKGNKRQQSKNHRAANSTQGADVEELAAASTKSAQTNTDKESALNLQVSANTADDNQKGRATGSKGVQDSSGTKEGGTRGRRGYRGGTRGKPIYIKANMPSKS